MTEIRCHYNDCIHNVDRRCTQKEIFISGNITCMDALSKEEDAKFKRGEQP